MKTYRVVRTCGQEFLSTQFLHDNVITFHETRNNDDPAQLICFYTVRLNATVIFEELLAASKAVVAWRVIDVDDHHH